MANPQEPEVRRSGNVPALNPDATEAVRQADRPATPSDARGPVPAGQQPGHRPDRDQDKPDLDAFAGALGIRSDTEHGKTGSRQLWQQPIVIGAAAVGATYGVVRGLMRRSRRG